MAYEEEVTVIIGVDVDWIYEQIDAIFEVILEPDMNQVEEARAIFNWIRRNISYSATIDTDFVYAGALQALQNRRGNCFVYCSISEVMLTRANIPNMRILRIPGQPMKKMIFVFGPIAHCGVAFYCKIKEF